MNELRVHGGGEVSDRTSCSVGLRGQYGPAGIERLSGLDGRKSPEDMKPCSSSASQSERADEQLGEVSRVCVGKYSDGGFRCFALRIALRRYFMGTRRVLLTSLPPRTEHSSFRTLMSAADSCIVVSPERFSNWMLLGERHWLRLRLRKAVCRRD